MKTVKTKCTPSQPDPGLTVEQAMQVHAGWDGAMKGLPFSHANGPHWAEGWLNFHWLKGGVNRSWRRH